MIPAIRPMTTNDIALTASWVADVPLWQRYGLTAEKAAAQFQQALAQHDFIFVVDVPEVSCAGFAWVLPQGAFGRAAYLRLIGVKPGISGGGLGTALLQHAEREAAAAGSQDMFLLVSDFNADAQRFYQRHGYAQIGAIPDFVLADITELVYRKRL